MLDFTPPCSHLITGKFMNFLGFYASTLSFIRVDNAEHVCRLSPYSFAVSVRKQYSFFFQKRSSVGKALFSNIVRQQL